MNILLVEDEKKIVDFVCCGFREQGFTIDHSADGNEGYEKASQREYVDADVISALSAMALTTGLSTSRMRPPSVMKATASTSN